MEETISIVTRESCEQGHEAQETAHETAFRTSTERHEPTHLCCVERNQTDALPLCHEERRTSLASQRTTHISRVTKNQGTIVSDKGTIVTDETTHLRCVKTNDAPRLR